MCADHPGGCLTRPGTPARLAELLLALDACECRTGEHRLARAADSLAKMVDGTDHAVITFGDDRAPMTTGPRAQQLLAAFEVPDVAPADGVVQRWNASADATANPAFTFVARGLGVQTAISQRVYVASQSAVDTSFTLFSTRPNAYPSAVEGLLLALASALSDAVSGPLGQPPAGGVLAAMRDHREIGIATGMVMALCEVDRDQAHALLRLCSQLTRQPIASVALATIDRRGLDARLLALGDSAG